MTTELKVWATVDFRDEFPELARDAQRAADLQQYAEGKSAMSVGFTGDENYQQIYVTGPVEDIVKMAEFIHEHYDWDFWTTDAPSEKVADKLDKELFFVDEIDETLECDDENLDEEV